MRSLALLLVTYLTANHLVAQTLPQSTTGQLARYTVPQLQADLLFVRQALEEVHPSLYWYTPKDSLDLAFARAAAGLTQPLDELEFWKVLQPLVARVHCGHTRIVHSVAYRTWNRQQPHYYFPFTVAVRKAQLFVAENQSTTPELSPGTELLAIDGHPITEVLPRLRTLISADGYNTGFQDQELEAGFFDDYYAALYAPSSAYQILVRDSTGQRLLTPRPAPASTAPAQPAPAVLDPAQKAAQRLAWRRSIRYPGELPATAILRLQGFDYEDYLSFHQSVFAELAQRHTRRLIIDLRNNPGGNNAIAVDLLSYLLKRKFVLHKSGVARVYSPSFMSPALGSKAYFDTAQVKRLPNGTLQQASASLGRQIPYRGQYFRGQVVVLVNGGTFSAASSFAASLRAQRRITIIGQETGGTEAGLNGGVISAVELPQTQMVLQLPHFQLLTACPTPRLGRGVSPDIEVVPTPQQLATHTDAIISQLPTVLP